MENSQVTQKAQEILDSFMDSMKDISLDSTYSVKREKSFREEGEGEVASEEFRQQFLNNANKSNQDAILANKGSWVE